MVLTLQVRWQHQNTNLVIFIHAQLHHRDLAVVTFDDNNETCLHLQGKYVQISAIFHYCNKQANGKDRP